jgi:hypothetical protein
MIQMSTSQWTQSALSLAFAISHRENLDVVLVKFIDVPHVQWLGSALGHKNFTPAEYAALIAYRTIAEDNGIDLNVTTMQYVTLFDAVLNAAEQLNAQTVFACLEPSIIPYWHKYQVGRLERRLRGQGRQFYSLEQPVTPDPTNWTSSVLVSSPPTKQ